ncbi:MAG: phosphatidate cytidylyltransferase [Spirochaetae bacterium HGW-Spirochaetae-1]|jgi:phosphatidate cytidylyltransferase|nr:MAG: phosphatidate cytidylyltransferase [Spirochaetae bacterium HGW-Spirochaetae-1]
MNDRTKETIKRIASALVALPVYFFAIITSSFQDIPLVVISLVISMICLLEFYQISEREEGKPFIAAGMVMAFLVNIIMYLFAFGKVYGYNSMVGAFDARLMFAVIVLFLAVLAFLQLFQRPLKGGIYSLSVTVFGVIFIVLSFSHIILMKALKDGLYYILILNATVMLNDTGAYFGGVLFGKHKTKFPASPNKSWEGYFSGLLFSMLGMMIINQVFASFFGRNLFTMVEAALIGMGLSFFGSIGDLIESAVKRDGIIKDSGSIIPGHGGMWDVFDALIVTTPLFYYYLIVKGIP